MKIRILNLKDGLEFILLLGVISAFIFLGVSMATESVFAGNVTNQTVISRVNVSNTEPNVYRVNIEHPLDSEGNIDLGAGNATTVICNGSFSDLNGFDDVTRVNATLYDITVASDALNDNNTHYINSSCLSPGQTCGAVEGEFTNGTCLCQFAVQYYANPTTWQCNMTITDGDGITSSQNSTFFTVNEILGINIETINMDFGNLSVTQTSRPLRQNVTNAGNIPINVTVKGFGGDNEETGQNLSMICDPSSGSMTNISFGSMRFDTKNETAFANMFNITNQTRQIFNLTIPQRTVDNKPGNSSNSTFWRLQIPLGAGGICNGTIIFGAIDATMS